MKKILTALAVLAMSASADFARVEIGAGLWSQTPSGTLLYTDNGATGKNTSSEKEENLGYAWLLIKHPVPIIPNLRVEYASIKSQGVVSGEFKNFEIPLGETTTTSLEITEYDIIPYYNILDNTFWVTIDLGIDIKVMDISYNVNAYSPIPILTDGFEGYTSTNSFVLPLVYVRSRVQIPLTNLGFEVDVKYVTYDSNTMYDIRAKIDYTLEITPIIQPGIEVGYRVQNLETNEAEDAKIDMSFAGLYAGIMLRF